MRNNNSVHARVHSVTSDNLEFIVRNFGDFVCIDINVSNHGFTLFIEPHDLDNVLSKFSNPQHLDTEE